MQYSTALFQLSSIENIHKIKVFIYLSSSQLNWSADAFLLLTCSVCVSLSIEKAISTIEYECLAAAT